MPFVPSKPWVGKPCGDTEASNSLISPPPPSTWLKQTRPISSGDMGWMQDPGNKPHGNFERLYNTTNSSDEI